VKHSVPGPIISRIDHVSLAVNDFKSAMRFFVDVLGAVEGAAANDDSKKFFWSLFSMGDLSRFEIISPAGKGSFLERFLSNCEGGVHHIALQTPDISLAKKALDENGVPYFGYYEYSGLSWKEIFIHPRDAFGVLIQIAEFKPDDWLDRSIVMTGPEHWKINGTDDGCVLRLPHPGGGCVDIELNKNEMRSLADQLLAIS
jgi:methylmalonyl-CoA/ethylmalonyl-CoA epimerase